MDKGGRGVPQPLTGEQHGEGLLVSRAVSET